MNKIIIALCLLAVVWCQGDSSQSTESSQSSSSGPAQDTLSSAFISGIFQPTGPQVTEGNVEYSYQSSSHTVLDNSFTGDSVEDSGLSSLSSSETGSCWLSSYGRGVGTPISTCPSGLQQDGELCYDECSSDFYGVGPVCWQSCPDGFTDTGADCLKPPSYGRGAGYLAWEGSQCNNDNPSVGCSEDGAIWYPNCQPGFHNVACCICSPDCPAGMTDIGVSCQKNAYGRGVGTTLTCASGQQYDAGLCYNPCSANHNGIGPVCWGTCPAGLSQCGALCLDNSDDCAGKIESIALDVFKALVDLANVEDDPDSAVSGVKDVVQDLIYPICS